MDVKLPTRYTKPLKISLALSVLAHLLLGMGLANALYQHSKSTLGMGPAPEPMVINLQPRRDQEKRLIETPVPAEQPPQQPDLIAEQHSQAADMDAEVQGEAGPRADVAGELEQLASAPPVPASPPPIPVAPATPGEAVEAPATESQETTAEEEEDGETPQSEPSTPIPPKQATPVAPRPMTRSVAREASKTLPPQKELIPGARQTEGTGQGAEELSAEDAALLEPFQVARNAPVPAIPDLTPRKTTGDPDDSAVGQGFTSFDAIRDEIAPYLKNIKMRVENRWREGIRFHYSGTRMTEAVVDCAIDAQGQVVSVKVVGTPDDRLFAAICEQAIEKAGPFGPFTFEVPDIYRSKNLEIRWTFSFLH